MKRIPKSNIKQSEIRKAFHNITKMSLVESELEFDICPKTIKNKPLDLAAFNTLSKNNSLLSLLGVLTLTVDFVLIAYFTIGSRRGWITLKESELCQFIHLICAPVLLPIIYFMRNPNYLAAVMRDMNLF